MSEAASAFDHLLGRSCTLELLRITPSGAFLAEPEGGPDAPSVLLLGPEIPKGAKQGDLLDVFVYLDSQDRPLATTAVPKLSLGQVAFLRVSAITKFGAFVDWGLPKELLVPFSQQTRDLEVGAREAIGLYLDDTGRLAGTMRVTEMLRTKARKYEQDEWVEGEAWRQDPEIGLFAIIERSSLGLVPRQEPHGLSRGQAAKFRVTNVLPDGKLELSLRGYAHEEQAGDAERILTVLRRPEPPSVGDKSDPDEVRDLFGLSKKAFKRAVGRLLKEQLVEIDAQGHVRLALAVPASKTAAPKAPATKR
ncbi:MAG TPA: S1-like domain-containing RNA-binding protein [Polyangiaceae bacterium]|nr:S1-like domain-containing RNA-binding protein [Polyangiaceae bacterium]